MDQETAATLLLGIETDRLVVFCGAGLSMAPPSELPSARRLAEFCAQKYQLTTGTQLNEPERSDLEAMAVYFKRRDQLRAFFIQGLVPWGDFRGTPNCGHDALADFLACGITEFVISTNVDCLIEDAALRLGEKYFYPVVNENDLNRGGLLHKPLIKLHGCGFRDPDNTVWCVDQLTEAPVNTRIEAFKVWLRANLPQRDLLVVGFWSDWSYLNGLLEDCVSDIEPRTVILVDPGNPDELEQKAPGLWNWAQSNGVTFRHIQESGAEFLEDLRGRFSRQFLIKILQDSREMYEDISDKPYPEEVSIAANLSAIDLYCLRRDFCGEPVNDVPRLKRPVAGQMIIGAIHLLLLSSGANLSGPFYEWKGRLIRLILANGQTLSSVKRKFSNEPPSPIPVNQTVCVGAFDDGGAPLNLVRSGMHGGIVRNEPTSNWITDKDLIDEIGENQE